MVVPHLCKVWSKLKLFEDYSSTSSSHIFRPRSFYYTKNRTSTAFSNFREFLKNENLLESLNVIFRIRSPKGIFGQNMSDFPNGSLTGVSRS